jgi:sphinganine-1-phosphate aldolase
MTDHPVPPEPTIKQFRERYETYAQLPPTGVPREEVLRVMREMAAEEQARWAEGYASGCVYNRDQDHIDFLIEAYAINSQSNPLHTDVWPSAVKYESEIVAMTASMLGGGDIGGGPGSPDGVCGTVSSGGSESIQLAMKTYRDYFRATKGITKPQMVVPETAHAAFDKSAQYFGIEIVHVPVGPDWRADVDAMADAVTDDTVVIVGSAPPFPHGIVDPIEELSEIARERGIGFHTDACLGGFVLPWAEKLGYDVPPFDFRLPGVTSISADTHKFGYAAKGTSVVACTAHRRSPVPALAGSAPRAGRRWCRSARRATSRPPAGSWRPRRPSRPVSRRCRSCGSTATRCSSSRSTARTPRSTSTGSTTP